MMLRWGIAAFVLASVAVAACQSEGVEREEAEPTSSVGSYIVRVALPKHSGPVELTFDPTGAVPATRVGAGVGVSRAALSSVLTDVSLNGSATWNAATRRLTANVRITNTSSDDFDEPQVDITSLSDATVSFELIDSGSGGVGSSIGYADIPRSGGADRNSAFQPWLVRVPNGDSFSFAVDVQADRGGSIDPDADDDSFNSESNEWAGDDCDDTDDSLYPGGGTCDCLIDDCSSCGEGECCSETTDSTSCDDGCECNITVSNEDDIDVSCEGSTCNVNCDDNEGNCQISSCSDSSCNSTCSQTEGNCSYETCDNGSSCVLDCELNEGSCYMTTCDGATCSLNCTNDMEGNCYITTCDAGSCSMTCGHEGDCYIDTCENGSTCNIDCGDSQSCYINCSSGSSCQIDCGTADSCDLDCDGSSPTNCGGGVLVCPPGACP